MNSLAKYMGGTDALTHYADKMAQAAASTPLTSDGLPILKLDRRSGDFYFGEDDVQVTEDIRFAVDPSSAKHGYVAFAKDGLATTEDGEQAEVVASIADDLIDHRDLPKCESYRDKGEIVNPKWKFFYSFELTICEAEDEELIGTKIVYKPVSTGGLKMQAKLLSELSRRLKMQDTQGKVVPIIEIWSESYEHKTYGDVFNPVYTVIDWAEYSEQAANDNFDDDLEDYEPVSKAGKKALSKPAKEEKPKRTRKRKPKAEEPEEEDDYEEEEKPKRTRTRRSKTETEEKPKRTRKRKPEEPEENEDEDDYEEDEKPKRTRTRRPKVEEPEDDYEADEQEEDEDETPRRVRKRRRRNA